MISFKHVTKRYPNGLEALSGVSFSLAQGQMAFLTGHSGAGKSTLLKLAAAIEQPSQGHISIADYPLWQTPMRKIPQLRRKIGLIFQNPHLLMQRSVFDNVALPLIICGFSQQDIAKRVRAALDKVGLLGKERCYPGVLSGGEQQRVGIARAIVSKPTVLLADEPTGNLDPELSAEIMRLFEQFNQIGVTVLIASHDLQLIRQLQHPILTLANGKLITQVDYETQ